MERGSIFCNYHSVDQALIGSHSHGNGGREVGEAWFHLAVKEEATICISSPLVKSWLIVINGWKERSVADWAMSGRSQIITWRIWKRCRVRCVTAVKIYPFLGHIQGELDDEKVVMNRRTDMKKWEWWFLGKKIIGNFPVCLGMLLGMTCWLSGTTPVVIGVWQKSLCYTCCWVIGINNINMLIQWSSQDKQAFII